MKTKDIIIIVLLLSVAGLCYLVGYRTGAQRETQKGDLRFLISVHNGLYQAAERGDLQKIQSDLGIVILGEVRTYENRFGADTAANGFARRFAEAQTIAQQVESRLVPVSSILTNLPHTSNATVTVEKDR